MQNIIDLLKRILGLQDDEFKIVNSYNVAATLCLFASAVIAFITIWTKSGYTMSIAGDFFFSCIILAIARAVSEVHQAHINGKIRIWVSQIAMFTTLCVAGYMVIDVWKSISYNWYVERAFWSCVTWSAGASVIALLVSVIRDKWAYTGVAATSAIGILILDALWKLSFNVIKFVTGYEHSLYDADNYGRLIGTGVFVLIMGAAVSWINAKKDSPLPGLKKYTTGFIVVSVGFWLSLVWFDSVEKYQYFIETAVSVSILAVVGMFLVLRGSKKHSADNIDVSNLDEEQLQKVEEKIAERRQALKNAEKKAKK